MNNERLISSIAEFAASKNIDRPTVIHMLRDVLLSLIEKKFGSENEFDVVIDSQKGDLQIWRSRTIIDDSEKETAGSNTITLSEARKIEADFEVGEEVVDEVSLDMFGRRAVMDALQFLMKKKRSLEKEQLTEQYNRLIGKVVSAEVVYSNSRETILYDDDRNELTLPKIEQIPHERFHKGSYIKVIISRVESNNKIKIIVSRASSSYLRELLSLEIPEIIDNIVLVKGIARIPGMRSKVVVESQDDRVDAAGACIGPGGRRIQAISKEHLNNERIDIITYTPHIDVLIKRIAGIMGSISVQESEDEVVIYAAEADMAMFHQNLPFLRKLLEKSVSILRNNSSQDSTEEEDVYLDEFADEVGQDVIDRIKEIGLTTAKSVLKISKEALASKTSLSTEILDFLYKTLKEEFSE